MTRLQLDLAKASWIVGGLLTALIAFAWAGTVVASINLPQQVAGAITACRHRVARMDRIGTSAASESTMLQSSR